MDFKDILEDRGDKIIVLTTFNKKLDSGEYETVNKRQSVYIDDLASIYKDKFGVRLCFKNGKSVAVTHSLEEMERYFLGSVTNYATLN